VLHWPCQLLSVPSDTDWTSCKNQTREGTHGSETLPPPARSILRLHSQTLLTIVQYMLCTSGLWMTSSFRRIGNNALYGEDYGRGISVSGRQRREGRSWNAEAPPFSTMSPTGWHPSSRWLTYPSAYYVKTWRNPQNRKYITYCTVIRGGPSHDHR